MALTERAEHVQEALKAIIETATEAGRATLTAEELERVNKLLDVLDPEEMLSIIETGGLG